MMGAVGIKIDWVNDVWEQSPFMLSIMMGEKSKLY